MSLTIDGEQIARLASMKYLGVEIDEKLNFKQHNTEENGKKSLLLWKNTTKTHQNCKDNHLQQHYLTTPGFLLLNSPSFSRTKRNRLQVIQNRAMMSLANTRKNDDR
jgi:hypothetical protein